MSTEIDPITRSVVQHRLSSIVKEMGEAMLRTSYSQILNSSRDFSLAICDVEGRLIAPRLDQEDAALILLRHQHVKLLAAVLGARALRVPFHQFDEGAAVLGLNLELDDDHQTAHEHSLRFISAA